VGELTLKKELILIICVLLPSIAFGVDSAKCSKMLNNGMWKTYKYGGMGESYFNALTQGTKKDGISKASSESSTTEPSTMMFDTKYTSNAWASGTQSTSSWGDCSLFTMRKELKEQRKIYIAQNLDELKTEMARGKGEHLKVLTFYSGCHEKAYSGISRSIQNHYEEFAEMEDEGTIKHFVHQIDRIIKDSPELNEFCYVI